MLSRISSNRTLKSFFLISFAFLFLWSGESLATSTGVGDVFPSIMRGVRPLGMGNAFIAMPGSDSIAQFYNPAAINDFPEERQYSVGVPMLDFNVEFWGAEKGLLDLKHSLHAKMSASDKINLFNAYTSKHLGEFTTLYTSMPLFMVRHKYYSFGAIGDFRMNLSFRNLTFPNFDFKVASSSGLVGGSAYSFFDDTLQIGGNAKLLFRMGKEDEVTSGDILVNSIQKLIGFQTWRKGIGLGFDAGLKYKIPFLDETLKPTVGLTVQDIGNTYFTGSAPKLPMSVSVGGGIFPKLGAVDFAILTDFRELNRKEDFLKKFHFGVEAGLPEIVAISTKFSLRAGCNQGYPAVGLSARFPKLVTFLVSYYGEEAGNYTHSKANYQLAGQFSWDF